MPSLRSLLNNKKDKTQDSFIVTVRGRNGTSGARTEVITCTAEDLTYLQTMLGIFRHQWDYLVIEKQQASVTKDLAAFLSTATLSTRAEYTGPRKQASLAVPPISGHTVYRLRPTLNEQPIPLDPVCSVTCPTTGIISTVALPSLPHSNLLVTHPLSVFANVQQVWRTYSQTRNDPAEILSANTLAGILLTTLRHHSLLSLGETSVIKANEYLSTAGRSILVKLLQHLLRQEAWPNLPKLSLADIKYDDAVFYVNAVDPEEQYKTHAWKRINAYINTCTGYDSLPIPATSLTSSRKTTIKVYTDKAKQEFKTVKEDKKSAATLAAVLRKRYTELEFQVFHANIRTVVDGLAYMENKTKAAWAAKIEAKFATDKDAAALARIFRETSTDTLASDLLSFSQEVEVESETKKDNKLNLSLLMSFLPKKG